MSWKDTPRGWFRRPALPLLVASLSLLASAVVYAGPTTGKGRADWSEGVVTSGLLEIIETWDAPKRSVGGLEPLDLRREDGSLSVEVIFEEGKSAAIRGRSFNGARVDYVSSNWDRAYLSVTDPDAIKEVAAMDGVKIVRPNYGGQTSSAGSAGNQAAPKVGKVTGFSTTAHYIDVARTRFRPNGTPVTGAGKKVGVLSDSFAITDGVRDGNTEPSIGQPGILTGARNQDSGDLPPQIQILREIDFANLNTASDEGAGMAELVYDMAPGVDIAFASAFAIGEAGFADGITRLASEAGCDVIVDDVIYFFEPMFQEGIVARAARDVVLDGIPYFSSAGNSTNYGLMMEYVDANPSVNDQANPRSGEDFHVFDNDEIFLPVTLQPGQVGRFILQWNQPYQSLPGSVGSQIDLDLLIYQRESVFSPLITAADDYQGETGLPLGDSVEFTGIVNPNPVPVTAFLAIDHWRGSTTNIPQDPDTPLVIRLISIDGAEFEGREDATSRYGGPSTWGHSNARGVVGVGAVPWFDTLAFEPDFLPTQLMDPEDFSSRGGKLTHYFDDAGNFAPFTTQEPDIAAVDGDNTTFFGGALNLQGYEGEPDRYPNFFGTSAAAPAAAAIAALMLEVNPSLTPAEILQIMQETAIDVAGYRAWPGVDDTTGHGLVDANRAIEKAAERAGLDFEPTPTPAAGESVTFDFESDPVLWTNGFVPEEVFTPAFASTDDGRLALTALNNDNSFGYMESPDIVAGDWQMDGDIPVIGGTGPGTLYEAAFTVASDRPTTDLLRVPVIRLRQSTEDFQQSNVMTITSATDVRMAPGQTNKTFRLFFELPDNVSRFQLYYDILNTGGLEAPETSAYLDQVVINTYDPTTFDDEVTDMSLNFSSNDQRWFVPEFNNPFFSLPSTSLTQSGLRMGPTAGGTAGESDTFFTYWSSPDDFDNTIIQDEAVKLESTRIYRASWQVLSSAANAEEAADLPAFRLRMNDRTLNYSTLLNVESIGPESVLPFAGNPVTYNQWFAGRTEIELVELLFAFDYLLVPGLGNREDLTITLQNFEVTSYEVPF